MFKLQNKIIQLEETLKLGIKNKHHNSKIDI